VKSFCGISEQSNCGGGGGIQKSGYEGSHVGGLFRIIGRYEKRPFVGDGVKGVADSITHPEIARATKTINKRLIANTPSCYDESTDD
jgi:hypothetical protein